MRTCVVAVFLLSLCACSSQPTAQRKACDQFDNMLEYDKCMRRANVGQDDAQKAGYK